MTEKRVTDPANTPGATTKTSAARSWLGFTYATGFIFGLALCFDGAFMPEFKTAFSIGYTRQMYILFCKNIPFLLFSIPIGYLVRRLGYKKCMAAGLLLFSIGTWLLVPGIRQRSYALVLFAFFVNGIAFNLELVSSNPMLAALGDHARSSSRLNLGNALGAVAQILAPLWIFLAIPSSIITLESKLPYITALFYGVAAILLLFAIVAFVLPQLTFDQTGSVSTHERSLDKKLPLWKNKTMLESFIAIFLVLGIEAGIFGLYRNFLEDPAIAGFSSHRSQQYYMLYFAFFALGRLAAWLIQKKLPPARHLLFNLVAASLLLLAAATTHGLVAIWCLTTAGFFLSIFFPSLYSLAIGGLGDQTAVASGLLSMGMVGAAILPLFEGWLADRFTIQLSLLLALPAYGYTIWFVGKTMNRSKS